MSNETSRPLSGPKILLMGPSGSGKTFSLGTLVDWAAANKKEVFGLFTENGLEALLGYWKDERPGHPSLPVPECLHYHQTLTQPLSLTRLMDIADKVGKLSYESLTKMQDPQRGGENNAFWKILQACTDFPDDRTGKKFGPIDTFGTDKIFFIDSLTELANAAFRMQIGTKPAAAPPDYGVAQHNLLNFLRLITQGMSCTFAITAHIDRQVDEISQTTKLMVKSIGRAPAADIPPMFSDVILTVREADQFYWDTAAFGADTKTRSLGYRSKIKPDFAQIMNIWSKRSEQ